MELDFTAQLQPALWGLLLALLVSTTALIVTADPSEIGMRWHVRLVRDWRRHVQAARASCERALARLVTIARHATNQLPLRERRKA
jgi:hypothetical protein